jgi:protein-S-isoprenylcysteine O-methyltransferase Ste14
LGIRGFASGFATAVGCLFLSLGLLLRVWATFCFYEHRMKVVSLEPQKALITTGPYGFSRNPLYLGGNVFIFFGAALSLGSPTALVITAIHIPLWSIDRLGRSVLHVANALAELDAARVVFTATNKRWDVP